MQATRTATRSASTTSVSKRSNSLPDSGAVPGSGSPVLRPRRDRREPAKRSALVPTLVVGTIVVLGAAVAGWFWSPFGRPAAPSSLVEATEGPTASPLATLEPGDCFASLESAWAADFAPISCEEPHTAQLTAIVPVEMVLGAGSGEDAAVWPGEDALRERAMLACQSPDAIDLEAAASIPSLEIQVRWPANETEWDAGVRSYHCFATADEQFDSLQPQP